MLCNARLAKASSLRKPNKTALRNHHGHPARKGCVTVTRPKCSQAICTAVSADEQAVSSAMLGPRKLKQ